MNARASRLGRMTSPVWHLAGRASAAVMTCLAAVALVVNPFASADTDNTSWKERDRPRIRLVREEADCRIIEHWGGTTRVPKNLRRICALGFCDELLALGVTPSAVATNWQGRPVDYLREHLTAAQSVPNVYGDFLPSFEAVAAAEPDLILACVGNRHTYEQLSKIAPTVVLRDQGTYLSENGDIKVLKQRLRDLALVLGRERQAKAYIAGFDAKVEAARKYAKEHAAGKTFAFFRTRGREWRLYGRQGMCGGDAIYDSLQLSAPAMVTDQGTTLDPEKLVRFDADYLILVSDGTIGAQQTMSRLQQHPLWRRVTAVKNGNVLEITTYRHWVLSGLMGKARMMDEVLACIRLNENPVAASDT